MPLITALRPSRRRPSHISVEVDGATLGSLPEREVEARGLAVGRALDDSTLAELEQSSDLAAALGLANSFLAHRPRSSSEVRQRFRKAGYADDVISAALERLTAQGLLNDRRFADMWVENRSTFSPRSARALEAELRRKGIDRETVDATLAESLPSDETASAIEAGRRRVRAFSSLDEDTFKKRMSGFLARRGFGYESVGPAVEALWAELIADR